MITARQTGRSPSTPLRELVMAGALALGAMGLAPRDGVACCPPAAPAEEMRWTMPDLGAPLWVGTDGADGVHAMFEDGVSLQCATSLDDGRTWLAPVTAVPERVGAFAAAVDEPGTVLVVYTRGGEIRFTRSTDRGSTFSPVTVLGAPIAGAPFPVMSMAPGGLTAVAWALTDPLTTTVLGIFARVSTDSGATWGPERRVDDGRAMGLRPNLAVQVSDETVVVAWTESSGGTRRLWTDRSGDAGSSWNVDESVTEPLPDLPDFQIGTTWDGHFQLAITRWDGISLGLIVTVSADDGRSWPGPDSILHVGPLREYRLLAVRGGRVHVAAVETIDGPAVLRSSSDRGLPDTWVVAPAPLPVAAVRPHHLRPIEGPAGVVNVVHDDYRHEAAGCPDPDTLGFCESIMVDRTCDGGRTWLADAVRLDTDGPGYRNHSEDPEVAVSRAGRLHVLWLDSLTAPTHVHHRAVELDLRPEAIVLATTTHGPDCMVSRVELSVDAARLTPCVAPSFQWHVDGMPIAGATGPTHEVAPGMAPGTHRYHVVVECASPEPCVLASVPVVVEVPEPLTMTARELSDSCPLRHELAARHGLVADCSAIAYQWYRDGTPIASATDSTWTIPADEEAGLHAYHVELTCIAGRPCGSVSGPVVLDVTPDVGPLTGLGIDGTSRVRRSPSGIDLVLAWSDRLADSTAHHHYQGAIGAWYSHRPLRCAIPRVPGAIDLEMTTALPAGDVYFLVAPANCLGEGSVGTNSFGAARPIDTGLGACGAAP